MEMDELMKDLEYANNICLPSHKYDHMQSKLNDLRRVN
jgi:hypothetical protein